MPCSQSVFIIGIVKTFNKKYLYFFLLGSSKEPDPLKKKPGAGAAPVPDPRRYKT